MRKPLPSGSRLHRAMNCAASLVLPEANSVSAAAEAGTARHEFFELVNRLGREKALERVSPEHRAMCEAISLDGLPLSSAEFASEVAFVYDVATAEAREIGRGIGREYEKALGRARRPTEMFLSADVVALVGDDAVACYDWKGRTTGDEWQLRIAALAACLAYNRPRATARFLYVGDDGVVRPGERFTWDVFDLDDFSAQLRGLPARMEAQRKLVESGEPPRATTGPWCSYCPSFAYCPAQVSLARHLGGQPETVKENLTALLDPETAGEAWRRLKVAKAVLRTIEDALYEFARQTPIDLGSGMVLAETVTTREEVLGATARSVLSEYGEEVVNAAVEISTSKTAVRDAIRPVAKERGVPLAALEREVLGKLRDAGAIAKKTSRTVKEVRRDRLLGEGE